MRSMTRHGPPARTAASAAASIIESRRRADHRRARRPRPSGQLRPAVHQGQHAAPDRGGGRSRCRRGCCSRCAARAAATRRKRVGWDDALDDRAPTASRDHPRTRPGRGRLLHLGPAADRGLLRLQQARQGPDRHQQRRHQLAPVHEQRGRRLQGHARRRRAAGLLRRPRTRRHDVHRRQQHGVGAPDPVPPHRGREARQPGAEDRSSPTRAAPRPPTLPTCTCRCCPAPTSRCSTACCTCCCGKA